MTGYFPLHRLHAGFIRSRHSTHRNSVEHYYLYVGECVVFVKKACKRTRIMGKLICAKHASPAWERRVGRPERDVTEGRHLGTKELRHKGEWCRTGAGRVENAPRTALGRPGAQYIPGATRPPSGGAGLNGRRSQTSNPVSPKAQTAVLQLPPQLHIQVPTSHPPLALTLARLPRRALPFQDKATIPPKAPRH